VVVAAFAACAGALTSASPLTSTTVTDARVLPPDHTALLDRDHTAT
jgi:hypothetical protein